MALAESMEDCIHLGLPLLTSSDADCWPIRRILCEHSFLGLSIHPGLSCGYVRPNCVVPPHSLSQRIKDTSCVHKSHAPIFSHSILGSYEQSKDKSEMSNKIENSTHVFKNTQVIITLT